MGGAPCKKQGAGHAPGARMTIVKQTPSKHTGQLQTADPELKYFLEDLQGAPDRFLNCSFSTVTIAGRLVEGFIVFTKHMGLCCGL